MKRLWNLLKNTWNNFWNLVLKYHSHVCLSFILVITFMIISLFSNQSWGDALLKSEKEKVLIQVNLNQAMSIIERQKMLTKDQGEFIDFQGEIMEAWRKTIEKQETTILNQDNILRQLVNYLKSIKHWPPKALPPIDPDTLAERSEAISHDKEKISYIR